MLASYMQLQMWPCGCLRLLSMVVGWLLSTVYVINSCTWCRADENHC